MPQAPLSNQRVSLFGIFFVGFFLCRGKVEGVGLWGSAWWRSEFVDRCGGGCGFVLIGICGGVLVMAHQSLGQSVMGYMIVRWLDR